MAYSAGYSGGYGGGVPPSGLSFPEIRVEIAFAYEVAAAGYFILNTSLLDTGTLATEYFVDVATWVDKMSTQRGVSRHDGVYARAQAGRATVVLDNTDRRFDPTNLAGPYVQAGRTEIVPMRVFRLQATWANVAYDLWQGFADEWRLDWNNGDAALTTLTGTDGTKVISNYDSVAGALVGSGETTGARINRILDNAGWAAAARDIDTGLTTVQSTDLANNAWTEILLTADTEIGEVYFDATNRVVFRNRHAILNDTRSATSQAVFGCDPGELSYDTVDVANDDTQVRNIIRISRVGGTVQAVQDAGSIAEYQRKTWGRSDLIMQTDTEAADYAAYVLSFSKAAKLRFDQIRITPTTDPDNLWPQVLGRELGDRITVKFTPPGGGTIIQRDAFIRGIRHDVAAPGRWVTVWALQDADTHLAFLVLDHASLGVLDANALAY